jgi:hypothetical protein
MASASEILNRTVARIFKPLFLTFALRLLATPPCPILPTVFNETALNDPVPCGVLRSGTSLTDK